MPPYMHVAPQPPPAAIRPFLEAAASGELRDLSRSPRFHYSHINGLPQSTTLSERVSDRLSSARKKPARKKSGGAKGESDALPKLCQIHHIHERQRIQLLQRQAKYLREAAPEPEPKAAPSEPKAAPSAAAVGRTKSEGLPLLLELEDGVDEEALLRTLSEGAAPAESSSRAVAGQEDWGGKTPAWRGHSYKTRFSTAPRWTAQGGETSRQRRSEEEAQRASIGQAHDRRTILRRGHVMSPRVARRELAQRVEALTQSTR